MQCPTTSWFLYGASIASTDNTKIYTLSPFGSGYKNLFFTTFSVSDGSVSGTRYVSTAVFFSVIKLVINEDFILAISDMNPNYDIILINLITNAFTTKRSTTIVIIGLAVEISSKR